MRLTGEIRKVSWPGFFHATWPPRWPGGADSVIYVTYASGNATHYVHMRGAGPNKIWAAKSTNDIQLWDGSKWTRVPSIAGQRIWVTSDTEV